MPRRKPVEEHLKARTFRKDRHGKLAGGFETLDKAPPCPKRITSQRARAAWDQIMPILAESGRLAPEDLPGLEIAFDSLGMGISISERLLEMDPVTEASKYRMLASTMDRMQGFFIDVLSRFGFTSKGREALAMTAALHKVDTRPSAAELMVMGDDEEDLD